MSPLPCRTRTGSMSWSTPASPGRGIPVGSRGRWEPDTFDAHPDSTLRLSAAKPPHLLAYLFRSDLAGTEVLRPLIVEFDRKPHRRQRPPSGRLLLFAKRSLRQWAERMSRGRDMRNKFVERIADTNKELLLVFTIIAFAGVINFFVSGQRLVLTFYNRSEEQTSELQSPCNFVCRLL